MQAPAEDKPSGVTVALEVTAQGSDREECVPCGGLPGQRLLRHRSKDFELRGGQGCGGGYARLRPSQVAEEQ